LLEDGCRGIPDHQARRCQGAQGLRGGREYDELLKFAQENLGPTCGPKNLDLCDEKQKKEIAEVQAMKDDDLKAKIKEKEDAISAAEKEFEKEVAALQAKYDEMSKAKEEKVNGLKNSGLSTLKMVWNDRHPAPPPPPPAPEEDGEGEGEGEGDEPPPEEEADKKEDL